MHGVLCDEGLGGCWTGRRRSPPIWTGAGPLTLRAAWVADGLVETIDCMGGGGQGARW